MKPVAEAIRPPLAGQRVLFVVPVTPAKTGNGLAMRSASLLRAMRDEGATIRLVIVPTHQPRDLQPTADIVALCDTWLRVSPPLPTWRTCIEDWSLGRAANPFWPSQGYFAWQKSLGRILKPATESILVVFRLSTYSFLNPRSFDLTPCWLDLDEVDSAALRGHAKLAEIEGREDAVRRLNEQATSIELIERSLLTKPRWLSVSSSIEQRLLPDRVRASVFVLPNTVPIQEILPLRDDEDGTFRCLFVGSFGHLPNVDAVAWFAREILPRLCAQCERSVEFIVAGPDFARQLEFLHAVPRVKVLGLVEDLSPVYRRADIVVVPLRAGAGTRIKILEAFSFGRAVVSTPTGAEGLRVTAGKELIIATEADDFAQTCAALLKNRQLQSDLANEALAFVRREHSPAALKNALRGDASD